MDQSSLSFAQTQHQQLYSTILFSFFFLHSRVDPKACLARVVLACIRAQTTEGANSRVKLRQARPSSIPFLTRFATFIASIPSLFLSIELVYSISLSPTFI
jgi:hypothetical protein